MIEETSDEEAKHETAVTVAEGNKNTSSEILHSVEGGKKDAILRRQELLIDSGLAEVFCITFLIL